MKRFLIALLFVSSAFVSSAFSATPSDFWLDDVTAKLEAKLAEVKERIVRYEGTAAKADRLADQAREAGKGSEATARQAALNARKAKEKAEKAKEGIENELASVRRLRAAFASGTDAEVAACCKTYGQLQQDIDANKRYGKEIEKAQAQLAEWTEKNDQAWRDAAMAGVEAVVASCTAALDKRVARATELRTGLNNMEGQLIGKYGQKNFNKLVSKLEVTSRSWDKATRLISKARIPGWFNAGADGIGYYEQFMNAVSEVALIEGEGDRYLAEAIRDPEVGAIINQDFPMVDLQGFVYGKEMESLLEAAGMSTLPVAFGDFLVKYGYSAADWALSRQRILQQLEVSEQQLKAVAALKKQMVHSMDDFKKCRAEILQRENIVDWSER
jgi:hypothetical protein